MVVFKLVEVMLFVLFVLVCICEEVGVLKGVLSVLLGKGLVIGDVFVCYLLVKKVLFIGGIEVGCGIVCIVVEKLMLVLFEFGGKLLMIVCDDVDFDYVVNGVLYGIFSLLGEVCIVGLWLFV